MKENKEKMMIEIARLFITNRNILLDGFKTCKLGGKDPDRIIGWYDELIFEKLFLINFSNYGIGRTVCRNTLNEFIKMASNSDLRSEPLQPELTGDEYNDRYIVRNYNYAIDRIREQVTDLIDNENYIGIRLNSVLNILKMIQMILEINEVNGESVLVIKRDLMRIFKLLKKSGYSSDSNKIIIRREQMEYTMIKLPMEYVEIIE